MKLANLKRHVKRVKELHESDEFAGIEAACEIWLEVMKAVANGHGESEDLAKEAMKLSELVVASID